jgi:hypothetical protein
MLLAEGVPEMEEDKPSVKLFVPNVILPEVNVNVPFTCIELFNVSPVELLIVKLLNVVGLDPPIFCALVPLKITVELLELNVPLLTRFPLTCSVAFIDKLKIDPEPINKFPELKDALVGIFAAFVFEIHEPASE